MTDTATPPNAKINPFVIPGYEGQPRAALCPWQYPAHIEHYIEVDNYAPSRLLFEHQFDNPTLLDAYSRVVLVAGDSGCGKSALRNHCVHLLRNMLQSIGKRAEVVNLTQAVGRIRPYDTILDIDQRISRTSEVLVDELVRLNLIDRPSEEKLRGMTKDPRRLYANLPTELDNKSKKSDVVLFLLLPTAELANEVQQYVQLPGQRIIYFAEATIVRSKADEIANSQDAQWAPVIMTVGTLKPGDARRFVTRRFEQGEDRGDFPRLADEVINSFEAGDRSIGALQAELEHVYRQLAIRHGDHYNAGHTIDMQEASNLFALNKQAGGHG